MADKSETGKGQPTASLRARRLTPAEIEALREDKRRASARLRELIAREEARSKSLKDEDNG